MVRSDSSPTLPYLHCGNSTGSKWKRLFCVWNWRKKIITYSLRVVWSQQTGFVFAVCFVCFISGLFWWFVATIMCKRSRCRAVGSFLEEIFSCCFIFCICLIAEGLHILTHYLSYPISVLYPENNRHFHLQYIKSLVRCVLCLVAFQF